jgi:hypothetical protein
MQKYFAKVEGLTASKHNQRSDLVTCIKENKNFHTHVDQLFFKHNQPIWLLKL